MIAVHCMACESHIANTDRDRLDYPLSAAMFSPVQGNLVLRPGLLDLDIFCPICSAFPFHYDPNTPGSRGVGKLLKVKGDDGKLHVLAIKQILMGGNGSEHPAPNAEIIAGEPRAPVVKTHEDVAVPAGPNPAMCPHCGAKAAKSGKVQFHKKGCPVLNPPEADPFILGLERRITGQGDLIPPDAPPTKAEVMEMLRERDARIAMEAPEPRLRSETDAVDSQDL